MNAALVGTEWPDAKSGIIGIFERAIHTYQRVQLDDPSVTVALSQMGPCEECVRVHAEAPGFGENLWVVRRARVPVFALASYLGPTGRVGIFDYLEEEVDSTLLSFDVVGFKLQKVVNAEGCWVMSRGHPSYGPLSSGEIRDRGSLKACS